MALSRIWSAFIIVAVLVALFKYLPSTGEKQIFSSMVIGKNGDTLEVKKIALANAVSVCIDSFFDDTTPAFFID